MAKRLPGSSTFTTVCGPVSSDLGLYSRVVRWARVILPLAALALLSTLFLIARSDTDTPAIPFAELDRMAEEQGISAPRISGMTEDGTVITITAKSARPTADTIAVTAPELDLIAAEGETLRVTAGEGVIDQTSRTATLSGLARLETSNGYLMETTGLVADLNKGDVTSTGPLEVQAPFGALSAGGVRYVTSNEGEGHRMDFTDGVKLVYVRPTEKDDP